MRIRPILTVCLVFLSASATALTAQVPEDLAEPKKFRALRLSSTDPNFHNGDSRPIAPGATLELGRIEGHGRITHIWFTIAGKSPDHLRELVFRIYWDGAEKPAVEAPLGDFFGLGFGRYVEYKSAPISIGGVKALNCYWPMPFAKGARLTMTNEGNEPVHACYFNIDYRLDDDPPGEVLYFHTQYRQAFPVPKGTDYPIVETTGRGHFVGTFLSVMANSDGWWGEGNDKFYVDEPMGNRGETDHRGNRQRGLFLRRVGFPARLLESLQRRAALHEQREWAARSAAFLTPVTAGTSSIRCRSRSRCG